MSAIRKVAKKLQGVEGSRPIPLFRSLNDDRGRGVISPVPTFFRQLQLFPSESLKIFAKLRPEKKRTARNQLLEITSPYLLPPHPRVKIKTRIGSVPSIQSSLSNRLFPRRRPDDQGTKCRPVIPRINPKKRCRRASKPP